MGRRKRRSKAQQPIPQPASKPKAPFNNPFSALSGLKEKLPEASQPATEVMSKPESLSTPEPEDDRPSLHRCGKLVVQREKKGRAGKTVTRIGGLPANQLDSLSKSLKKSLGCGATLEGDDLLLLGALVERAVDWLEDHGARQVVVSGASSKKRPNTTQRPSVSAAPLEVHGPKSWREATRRDDLEPGLTVDIVLKKDQRSGTLTRGVIQDLLTKKPLHPRGIKVRLADGQVGRVKRVIEG